jgi:hypothetical protein
MLALTFMPGRREPYSVIVICTAYVVTPVLDELAAVLLPEFPMVLMLVTVPVNVLPGRASAVMLTDCPFLMLRVCPG